MSKYVLIHGAWHGKWCWEKVVPLLEQAGHEVEAVDLPGHGEDKTPIAEISLQAYVDKVCAVLDNSAEPVILVGHSMGGVVITQVAELRPEKIASLVYLTAFMPKNGQTLKELGDSDKESLTFASMNVAEDHKSSMIRPEALRELFYEQCSEADLDRAASSINSQALSIFETPVKTTEENFGRIPRYYIECLRDKALTHTLQQQLYETLPFEGVFTIDTDHSPFYSTPELLASHLMACHAEQHLHN